ncbi:hypothetical protein D3C71_1342630 [compost metagenome]
MVCDVLQNDADDLVFLVNGKAVMNQIVKALSSKPLIYKGHKRQVTVAIGYRIKVQAVGQQRFS